MPTCIFCSIAKKEIPATLVMEDEDLMVFHDIHPKAKHHLLIVPKRHIDSVMSLQEPDQQLMGKMIWKAKKLGEHLQLEGYQLKQHVGAKGGQEVFHIHLHFLAD